MVPFSGKFIEFMSRSVKTKPMHISFLKSMGFSFYSIHSMVCACGNLKRMNRMRNSYRLFLGNLSIL